MTPPAVLAVVKKFAPALLVFPTLSCRSLDILGIVTAIFFCWRAYNFGASIDKCFIKCFLWDQSDKLQLTIEWFLYLYTSYVSKWVQHAKFCYYYWLIRLINCGDHFCYAITHKSAVDSFSTKYFVVNKTVGNWCQSNWSCFKKVWFSTRSTRKKNRVVSELFFDNFCKFLSSILLVGYYIVYGESTYKRIPSRSL